MPNSHKAKAVAKRDDFNPVLWLTISFFGLLPIALATSLAAALCFHLVH